MALGVPVVATDIGGSRELVEDGRTGLLVPVDDPRQLASAVMAVLGRPERTRLMTARARELVTTRFTLEQMVSSYAALYEEALQTSARPLLASGCQADPVIASEALRPENASHHVR
jgi:glycosyltransferase involved in cell wall biosynthesis